MRINAIERAVDAGTRYLLTQNRGGKYREFDGLAYGASGPWVTACVASSLLDVEIRDEKALAYLLRRQRRSGGWSYNWKVPSDADSTLRVLQFLSLVGFTDENVIAPAERFVLAHQTADGGIATYQPSHLIGLVARGIGYRSAAGWTSSHGCVSALALNVLRRPPDSLREYVARYVATQGFSSYWWRTPFYIGNETDRAGMATTVEVPRLHDSIEASLALIMQARHDTYDPSTVERLVESQRQDGSFPGSGQFRIPRPNQLLENEVPVEDP